jgi:DNA polymerase III delta subunit
MFLLIHGEDQVSSRKILSDKKNELKDNEILTFDGNVSNLSDILSYVDSSSIFGNQKVIILENIFQKNILDEKEKIIKYLKENKERLQVIFWEGKVIEKNIVIKYFNHDEIVLSASPLIIFKFLDSIGIEAKQSVIALFHSVLKQRDAFFILSMLYRQFRFLLIAVETKGVGLDQLSPWQTKKFISRGKYFSADQLKNAYRNLLLMEYNVKNGKTPLSLAELLDIFLVTL